MAKKTMDFILILLYITVIIFTGLMYWTYMITGGIPDTLCTCFFVAVTGECGFMGWIKTAKTRAREQELQQKYEQSQKELMELQRAAEEEYTIDDILGDN